MWPSFLARAKGRDRGIFEVTNSCVEATGSTYAHPHRPSGPQPAAGSDSDDSYDARHPLTEQRQNGQVRHPVPLYSVRETFVAPQGQRSFPTDFSDWQGFLIFGPEFLSARSLGQR